MLGSQAAQAQKLINERRYLIWLRTKKLPTILWSPILADAVDWIWASAVDLDTMMKSIRTYIKDGVLNAYTKKLTKAALAMNSPAAIVQSVYAVEAVEIQTYEQVTVLRAPETGAIYVISKGRVLKWETALKKALELIAREPNLVSEDSAPDICLHLAMLNSSLTDSEKDFIRTSLSIIGVKAVFCGE